MSRLFNCTDNILSYIFSPYIYFVLEEYCVDVLYSYHKCKARLFNCTNYILSYVFSPGIYFVPVEYCADVLYSYPRSIKSVARFVLSQYKLCAKWATLFMNRWEYYKCNTRLFNCSNYTSVNTKAPCDAALWHWRPFPVSSLCPSTHCDDGSQSTHTSPLSKVWKNHELNIERYLENNCIAFG